ncbi:MAG TPA: aminotransferase class I/II-fold pyridoxal phosphate-dependent enzyme [Holophagaceae bacterium]|nr:aminotransferase class I/II-fold pyridoxal phosphate-dependent enzyme [Holophagaceae bacterium]
MSDPRAELARIGGFLREAADLGAAFREALPTRPVIAPRPFRPEGPLPERGRGTEAVLAQVARDILPALSASAGPRYLGFVTGGSTPAALVGDVLVASADQNLSDGSQATATALQRHALVQLRELFGLPGAFEGTFVTGGTQANLVGLAVGRQWAAARLGYDAAEEGLTARDPIPLLAASPHASLLKAAAILGLGRRSWVPVASHPGTEILDPEALEAALEAHGGRPTLVAASAATVTTTAFDDLARIADLCERHGAYLHVDGAFGLFAAASPRFAARLEGLERADSVATDAHKWLNVPYDAGLLFTRHADLQAQVFKASAAYLGSGPDFFHHSPENSQRWRGLPTWMTLQAYGREGVRTLVERSCDLASQLGAWVEASPDYDLLAPVTFNIACFAPTFAEAPKVLDWLARDGRCFLTPGAWRGRSALRAAFSNFMTSDADLAQVIHALEAAARELRPC